MFPIAIDRELPQIQLQFGLMDSDVSIRPTVSGIVDSGASLCTGNLAFFTALCKAFPHIVDSIIIAKADGFAPICLSGIVKEDEREEITSELLVLYTLRMPYTLRLGGPVQLQVACGQSVSVNFLIGNTFLKRAVATLCYATHTLRCENLSSNRAFPLIYKAPTLSIPDVARVQGANLARDAEVVKNLDLLSVMFGIPPAKSTGLSSEQGQALKTSFRPARYSDDQGNAGDTGWGQVQTVIPGLDSSSMTIPPVPTTGVLGQYGPEPPASSQQVLSDGGASSTSVASQYETLLAASLGANGESPSSGDDDEVAEIE